MNKKKILGNKYVSQCSGDYFSKPWYERDLMHYCDYVKIKKCVSVQQILLKIKKLYILT